VLQAKNDQGARQDKKKQKKEKTNKTKQKQKKEEKKNFRLSLIVTLTKQPPPEESVDSCLIYTVGNRIIDIPSILSE